MRFLPAFLTTALLALPLSAAAQSGPDIYALYDRAQTDPAGAREDINRALAELQFGPPSSTPVFFDLALLRAEVAIQLEDWAEAATLFAQLAQVTARTPSVDGDPVELWQRAADAAERAGNLRGARDAWREVLSALADRTPRAETLAHAHDEIARLSEAMGDQPGAEASRAAAQAARAAPERSATKSRSDDPGFRAVDVYYATDRAPTGNPEPTRYFGAGRGDGLNLGIATVTVPNSHKPGLVEAPSIWKLEFAPNPAKHVVLQSVTPLPADSFFGQMQGEFADGAKTEAFVFVHGYNVAFDQAARRAAQIAVDMGYPAVPILYSWPSHGRTLAYVADTAVVRLSGRRLAGFLDDLVDKSGATTIHIIAHSMGNRAMTDALEILALKRQIDSGDDPLFGQVVFAAPDVDAGLFTEMIRTIRPIARRLTLYASEQDWALVSSRKLHGNAPRAGQGGVDTLASADIDSIDMSELGEDMLAHSYFADDNSALADMVALFWRNAGPERRCGLEKAGAATGGPQTWRYRRDQCQVDQMLTAMAHLRQAQVDTVPEALTALSLAAEDDAVRKVLEPVIARLLEQ